MEGDLALTAASLVEPFLIAEQRDNPGEVGYGITAVELRSFRC
jgi:hypothetical protein